MHKVSTEIGGHQVIEEDEQKLRVRLVGRDGRRRYDAASKERL
ncbi:IS66 family insertion sequence element accessory protein TnpB, partial [Mesorhizobium sp. M0306]